MNREYHVYKIPDALILKEYSKLRTFFTCSSKHEQCISEPPIARLLSLIETRETCPIVRSNTNWDNKAMATGRRKKHILRDKLKDF